MKKMLTPIHCPKCNEELRTDLCSEGKLRCLLHGYYMQERGVFRWHPVNVKD
jgi:hypothetical protein